MKGYNYGTTIGEPWEDKTNLVHRLFDRSSIQKPMSIKYFDLPQLHLNTKVGWAFWAALGNSKDTEKFDKMSI